VHNNYYLIRQLVPHLKNILVGSTLTDCFSQNKNELILQFEDTTKNTFNIIAHLDARFTCLAFPKEFHKARKNAAPIFNTVMGNKVLDLEGFLNERAFSIKFEDSYALLFKLFGHQSNLILLKKNKVREIFKNRLKGDFKINLDALNKKINQSKEAIIKALPGIKTVYPTLSKQLLRQIELKVQNLNEEAAYVGVQNFITELKNPTRFYICKDEGTIMLSLLPAPSSIAEFDSPIEGLTFFFKLYLREEKHRKMKMLLSKKFEKQIKKTDAYILKTNSRMNDLLYSRKYSEYADLIMANLHIITPYCSSIVVDDFHGTEKVSIKLNPKLSAQNNAEKYYRKAKNVATEIMKLADAVTKKEALLGTIEKNLEMVKNSESLLDLQVFTKELMKTKKSKHTPFKQFEVDGFMVLVGNNAKQNDLLTLKHAKKDDLFFHAKDVSGSHVILKQVSGTPFPGKTLEKVAAIAAYYSKKKTDSLCAVGYTPKKYVRKPKGSAAGLVLVEREKVLLVKPELPV